MSNLNKRDLFYTELYKSEKKEISDKILLKLKKIFNTENISFYEWTYFSDWKIDDSNFLIDWHILLIPNNKAFNSFFITIIDDYVEIHNLDNHSYNERIKSYGNVLEKHNIAIIYSDFEWNY